MPRIDRHAPGGPRLISEAILTPADFQQIAAESSGGAFTARKSGLIAARIATHEETIETRWNGKETSNVARPGDYIVTNLDAHGTPLVDRDGNHNDYVIAADRFPQIYEDAKHATALGHGYRARATVQAIFFPGGFEILAPWGDKQVAVSGYLLLNGTDVYGNHAETFEASYEKVAA